MASVDCWPVWPELSASRLYSATGLLGNGYELDAIAAVILGGISFTGGIGTIPGTLLGALIIAVLNNGLTLPNMSYSSFQVNRPQ